MRRKNAGRVIIVRERAGAAHHQSKRHIRSFRSIANEPVGLVSGGAHPSDDSSPWASPLRQTSPQQQQSLQHFRSRRHRLRQRPAFVVEDGSGFGRGRAAEAGEMRARGRGRAVTVRLQTSRSRQRQHTPPTTSSIRGAV